jgi:hypothetical protein
MSIYAVNGKEPIAAWIPSLDTAGNGTTTLTDLVGSNNGTLTNMDAATDWVADTDAGGVRALDFDGTNDYVVMGNARAAAFSLSIWVKGAAQSDRRFFAFGSSSSNNPAYAFGSGTLSNTSKFRIFIRNDGLGTLLLDDSNGNVFDGTWHHVLWTDNAGSASLYIDGALDKTFAYTPSTTTLNVSSIGAWARLSPVSFFIGRTDDARIFHSELDLADAQYLWSGGFGRGVTAGGGIIPILRQHYAAQGAR